MRTVCLPLWILAACSGVAAQSAAGMIVHTEGAVYLDGKLLPVGDAAVSIPDNATVRTEAGRAEIRLAAGDGLYLGQGTSARVAVNRPYNFNRIEVLSGSAVIVSGKMASQLQCEDPVRLSNGGIFRVDRRPVQNETFCDLKVFQGAAAVQLATFTAVLAAGERMGINQHCGDMIPSNKFDVRTVDALDQWSRGREARR